MSKLFLFNPTSEKITVSVFTVYPQQKLQLLEDDLTKIVDKVAQSGLQVIEEPDDEFIPPISNNQ